MHSCDNIAKLQEKKSKMSWRQRVSMKTESQTMFQLSISLSLTLNVCHGTKCVGSQSQIASRWLTGGTARRVFQTAAAWSILIFLRVHISMPVCVYLCVRPTVIMKQIFLEVQRQIMIKMISVIFWCFITRWNTKGLHSYHNKHTLIAWSLWLRDDVAVPLSRSVSDLHTTFHPSECTCECMRVHNFHFPSLTRCFSINTHISSPHSICPDSHSDDFSAMMVTQTNKYVCVIPLIHPSLPCECPLGLSMGSV